MLLLVSDVRTASYGKPRNIDKSSHDAIAYYLKEEVMKVKRL
jgi:hypothetical protein